MLSPSSEQIFVNEGGARLQRFLAAKLDWSEADAERVKFISGCVPGWSDARHYAFFKLLLASGVRDILILGVYRGRDMAFILDIAKRYHQGKFFRLTGVDKFSSGPCADWPEEKRGMTWEEAGFGPPPSIESARRVLDAIRENNEVRLERCDDIKWLRECGQYYDAVHFDTSHDFETVAEQLGAVGAVCHADTLLCGDDYSNQGTWGVKRAVEEGTRAHQVLFDWLWFSSRPLLAS